MRLNLSPRKAAACIFLVAAIMPLGILCILAEVGGVQGMQYLLTAEGGGRHTVVFLTELTVFLSLSSGLLFSSLSLAKSHQAWLIGLTACHVCAGIVFASASVPPVGLALAYLIYLHRKSV